MAKQNGDKKLAIIRLIARALMSIVLVGCATALMIVIDFKEKPEAIGIASWMIGLAMGFWLK